MSQPRFKPWESSLQPKHVLFSGTKYDSCKLHFPLWKEVPCLQAMAYPAVQWCVCCHSQHPPHLLPVPVAKRQAKGHLEW